MKDPTVLVSLVLGAAVLTGCGQKTFVEDGMIIKLHYSGTLTTDRSSTPPKDANRSSSCTAEENDPGSKGLGHEGRRQEDLQDPGRRPTASTTIVSWSRCRDQLPPDLVQAGMQLYAQSPMGIGGSRSKR